jgi:alkanesulfonate monooxygenase SsuD/methylene tetrahydromethanopterin reductase-like flavin-dependent oxidoreductase (luciferase family)
MKAWETYLVEHYRPGASLDDLESAVRDVRLAAAEMARRSRPVRCVHCTIVPSDEALLALFEARSEELVHEVCAHAGMRFERISGAVWHDAGTDPLTSPKGAR